MFKTKIAPPAVRDSLQGRILVDGFEMVLDLDRSRGPWLVDARDGSEYIDFFTYFASMPLGLNHPRLANDDVIRRMGRIALNKPTNSDIYTTVMAEFVETFFRVAVPDHFTRAFFIEGGAVAVENALKAAFDWKVNQNLARGFTPDNGHPDGRGHKIIHFRHCFHGRTGYTLSMTDSPDKAKTQWYPKFSWPRVDCPAATFPLAGGNLERTIDAETRVLRQIEQAVEENPHDVAALIIEPIQGEGGDNHFRPEFHRELRRLADAHEFLLIHDEVQTGMGLTGRMWCHQTVGVEPDLLCFGKKFQVCGVLAGRRLDQNEHNVFNSPGRINSTWGGNLVDMARCQLYLEVIEEDNLIENARREGALLLAGLERMQEDLDGLITNARGQGLMCAFDLTPAVDRRTFLNKALEEKVVMLPCGERSVRFRPPLSIDREVLEEGLRRVKRAILAAREARSAASSTAAR